MRTFQEFVSEMTYGRGRGPIGGADRDNSPRYRNLGSPTPEQEKESKSRADKAAADAVAKLRRARARGMKEEVELDEGMTMKDFKANRQKNKRKAASADAEKRGHVGKGWYNSGRKYSPDEAKRMRSNLDDEERRTRHRTAVEPDNENDDDFSADKTKNPKKLRKQKAMGELGEGVAGDVAARAQKLANQKKGQTPERKATYQSLANKASARQRKQDNPGDLVGASRFERSKAHGPQITPASSQRASEKETLGGGTYERGAKRLPKDKKYKRQVASGVRAASSQEKKRLGVGENYDVQELFITKLTPEQKRKKQVETLIRLMKHAKDPAADTAKIKK